MHYRSQHPLPRKIGHGFCYINVPHVHDFGPSDPRLYREVDGEYYFVGDPAPFDYEGPRYSFYGPHPVVEADVQLGQPVYCYLNGPHYHWLSAAAAGAVRVSRRRLLVRRQLRPGLLPGPAALRDGQRGLPADRLHPSDRRRHRRAAELSRRDRRRARVPARRGGGGRGTAGGIGRRDHRGAAAPQVQVGIGIGIGGPPVVVGGPPPVIVEQRRYEHDATSTSTTTTVATTAGTSTSMKSAAGGAHRLRKRQPPHPRRLAPAPAPAPQGGGWRPAPAPAQPCAPRRRRSTTTSTSTTTTAFIGSRKDARVPFPRLKRVLASTRSPLDLAAGPTVAVMALAASLGFASCSKPKGGAPGATAEPAGARLGDAALRQGDRDADRQRPARRRLRAAATGAVRRRLLRAGAHRWNRHAGVRVRRRRRAGPGQAVDAGPVGARRACRPASPPRPSTRCWASPIAATTTRTARPSAAS